MAETSGGEMMLHDGPFEEKAREQRGKKGEIGAKKNNLPLWLHVEHLGVIATVCIDLMCGSVCSRCLLVWVEAAVRMEC